MSLEKNSEKNTSHVQHNNFDLPPYPEVKPPQKQMIEATPRTNKPLIEEFPPGLHATVAISKHKQQQKQRKQQQQYKRCIVRIEETTFPGFATYQMAKAYYCLGQYSKALDTTTECLAFQKLALSGGEGSGSSATAAMSAKGIASAKEVSPVPSSMAKQPGDDMTSTMTPLDLRSTFATSVGSSVLNVVQSLKDVPTKGQPHPMLSNSIANMIAKYPSHPCVAQTLLLRGHVLAACALHGYDDNEDEVDYFSLIAQAVQHVEMAVAIQRKLSIFNEELAEPLIFLGKLKTRLGQFEEANMAYKEALAILRGIRSHTKNDQLHSEEKEDSEAATDCAEYLVKVSSDIAHAFYLHGKSYHCQRLHAQAFDCYSNALKLLKKSGASQDSSGVRCVVRCMKNRHALEKLISAYWDDAGAI